MQLKQLYDEIRQQIDDLDARRIIQDCTSLSWSDLIARPETPVLQDQIDTIRNMAQQRLSGTPLSRITGVREFWGLEFKLNAHTLDPRPETELLVEKALAAAQKINAPKILDLGTGTGCIPISLLKECPDATAIAVDLSAEALSAAKANAINHGVESRIEFIQSNWFESVEGTFDLILSNPPYIDSDMIPNLAPEVQNHDPILALDGGEKGLEPYKIIFSNLKKHLKAGGSAFFEIGYDQCGYIARLAEKTGIRIIAIHPDLAGIPRVAEISCGDK